MNTNHNGFENAAAAVVQCRSGGRAALDAGAAVAFSNFPKGRRHNTPGAGRKPVNWCRLEWWVSLVVGTARFAPERGIGRFGRGQCRRAGDGLNVGRFNGLLNSNKAGVAMGSFALGRRT